MDQYEQHQAPAPVYPPVTAYPPPSHAEAPPAGYPTGNAPPYAQQVPIETRSRGDGFWKGCAAALCCCCALEACF